MRCILFVLLISLAAIAPQIRCVVPGRILEDDADVGVGTAEEVPISSFTLTFSEPEIQIQRAMTPPSTEQQPLQTPEDEALYDELHEDYNDEAEEETSFNVDSGEGSIESIPIESMRVRFEPAIQRFQSTKDDSIEEELDEESQHTEKVRCHLPVMPPAMVVAAEHCNVELVFHRPDFPGLHLDNRTRTGRPSAERSPRRLDTSLRTACGSKCVLGQLKFLRESGAPDADAVTRLLIDNADATWAKPILVARDACSPLTIVMPGKVLEEKEQCNVATNFMKCIRNTMIENCPPESLNKERLVNKEKKAAVESEDNGN